MLCIEQFARNIGQHLLKAGIEEPFREAQLLITKACNWDIGQMVLKATEPLPDDFPLDLIQNWSIRRQNREPLAYIWGERDFFGRTFDIGYGALIPRPDSETLIEWLLEDHATLPFECGVDLCCGPGTLGITATLETQLPVTLVDVSSESLIFAKKNVVRWQTTHQNSILQLDLLIDDLTILPKVDFIICNPPYIADRDMDALMPEVKNFEPHLALRGGVTGLEFFASLLPRLSQMARPRCKLYVELGAGQQILLDSMVSAQGWTRESWRQDLAGIPRVVRYTFLDQSHG